LEKRKTKAKKYIEDLMNLTDEEKEYMIAFENKQYKPELLFTDRDIVERVKVHPMAIWKCRND
jgi:hypothetical protein